VNTHKGFFGEYGGRYAPEMLVKALDALAAEYEIAKKDKNFQADLLKYRRNYIGGPSPLVEALRLQSVLKGPRIFL